MTQNVPRGTMTIGNALRTALGIFSGKMIFICETGRSADLPVSLFSRMGANPLRHALQRARFPLLSLCDIFPRPGEVFPLRGSFLHLPVSTNKAPPFGGAGIEQSEMTERSFP